MRSARSAVSAERGSAAPVANDTPSGRTASRRVGAATRSDHPPPSAAPKTRVPTGGPEPSAAAATTIPATSWPGAHPSVRISRSASSPRWIENACTSTTASSGAGAGSGRSACCKPPGAEGSVTKPRTVPSVTILPHRGPSRRARDSPRSRRRRTRTSVTVRSNGCGSAVSRAVPTPKRKPSSVSKATSSKPAPFEVGADHGCGVRRAPVAGPDHRRTRTAQFGHVFDRVADVVVRHVAEDAADQHEIGRHRAVVRGGDRCVTTHAVDAGEAECASGLAGVGDVARVELHHAGPHVVPARMVRQRLRGDPALAPNRR